MQNNLLQIIKTIIISISIFVISNLSVSPDLYASEDSLAEYLNQKEMSNYSKAMEIIEEWTINENDPAVIETNVFRINELIKYPELIDMAVNIYKKIKQNHVIQNNNFLKSRIDIFLNMLFLRKGNVHEAALTKQPLGLITDFKINGPFTNPQNNTDYDIIHGYNEKNNTGWFDAYADLSGKIDMSDLFEDISNSIFYLKCNINIREEGNYIIWLGKTGFTDIWMDGNKVFSGRKRHDFSFDQYRLDFSLSKGKHNLIVKTGDSCEGIKLALRLTDKEGRAVTANSGIDSGLKAEDIHSSILKSSFFNALENTLNKPEEEENHLFNSGYLYYISGLNSEEDSEADSAFSKINDRRLKSAADYYLGQSAVNPYKKNQYFNESITAYNKNIESINEIINIKLKYKLIYEAYPLAESIKEINPQSYLADKLKARIFISLGWDNEALKQAERLKINGYKSCGNEIESSIFSKQRRFMEALKAVKDIYTLDRFNMSNLNNYIEYSLSTGKYEEAESLLNQCAGLFPGNIKFRLKLAAIQDIKYPTDVLNPTGLEHTGAALPYLLSARRISPHHSKVLQNIGLTYHKLNKNDLAIQFLTEALRNDPKNTWIGSYIKIINNSKKKPVNMVPEKNTSFSKSQPPGSFQDLEKEIFKSYASGNIFDLYNNIENLLFSYPSEAESIQYYHDIAELSYVYGSKKSIETLNRVLDMINKAEELKNKNLLLLKLNLEIENLSSRNIENKEKNIKESPGLQRWSVIGPFLKYGSKDIDYSFMPEITLRLNNSDLKKKEIKSFPGKLVLSKYLYPEKGIAYAITTIECKNPVKIRIYSSSAYKIFINGKETIRNLRSGTFRTCRILKVWDSSKITLMIKSFLQDNSNTFRFIITDENDRILNVESDPDAFILSDFKYKEEMDYPYDYFSEKINTDTDNFEDFRLGRYFHELGSTEAIEYFRKALSKENIKNIIEPFYLAKCMGSIQNPDIYAVSISMGDDIAKKSNSIPAMQIKLKNSVGKENTDKLLLEYQDILSDNISYLPIRLDYAALLMKSGYGMEFIHEISALKNIFPESIDLLRLEAKYYETGDIQRAIEIYKKILKLENIKDIDPQDSHPIDSLGNLINIYKMQEKYEDIRTLIGQYDTEGYFIKENIENLINWKKYNEAKSAIFKELTLKDDPYYNIKLGEINYLESQDPFMYWQKALFINPSNFSLNDYLAYLETGKIDNPFHAYTDENINKILPQIKNEISGNKSVNIVKRNMVFIINSDGGDRIFSEDLIQYNSPIKSIMYIPFPGEIHPVRLGYYKNGEYNNIFVKDSDLFSNLNNTAGIVLPAIENSLVQISYYIDNPPVNPKGSIFHNIPYIKIHEIPDISIKVITPKDMKIKFFSDMDTEMKPINTAENILYSLEITNITKASSDLSFSFSTMNDTKDLVLWYSGIMQENFNILKKEIPAISGKSPEEVIHSVYDLIMNNIKPENNILFSPKKATDTLYSNKGSAENKTICAASILSGYGIKSYIALAGKRYSAGAGFISPESFTSILLYIPLDLNTELWMDFSDTNNKYGEVSKDLSGQDALVIIKDGYEIKKIK